VPMKNPQMRGYRGVNEPERMNVNVWSGFARSSRDQAWPGWAGLAVRSPFLETGPLRRAGAARMPEVTRPEKKKAG